MEAIVCPNCGANATNHENCEYCGSLLVRFVDQNIQYNEDNYNDPEIVETKLGDILDMHLTTAKQPGIGGVCTHIRLYTSPDNLALQEETVCYVMNGAYLTKFGLELIDPSPSDTAKNEWTSHKNAPFFIMRNCSDRREWFKEHGKLATKFYDLSTTKYYGSSFVLVKPIINFGNNAVINSSRWEPSMNLIRISQLQKRPLLRKDFAKLLYPDVHQFDDYNIELYIMDFGEDIQGAASIISQMDDNVLDSCESYMETVPVEPPIVKPTSFFKKLF